VAKVLLENVTKIFDGNVTATSNVTLDVADQEFLVVVGPSGCGKTTMLRLIAGLEEPTSGTIVIGDRVVNKVPPKDRDIAMVFQNYALYPHMNVFKNMAFALKVRKYPRLKVAERVGEVARLLGIENLLAMRPATLSGGERQRVALGRAIVRNPKVFLLDEPFSNLDAQLRLATRAELKSLQRKLKVTTIFVTHDQAEAMTLGDHISVLYKGVVQQIGTPMEVYSKPVNRFVAGFFGLPPMNFLSGPIDFEKDKPRFCLGQVKIDLPVRSYSKLLPYKGKEIVLGVRPEHLSLYQIQGQGENVIKAEVELVEPLGARTYVYFTSIDGTKLVADVSRCFDLHPGSVARVHLDVEQLHIFEPSEMGRNVSMTQ
jgi:multiple sugar transport system ATP-binding protein